MSHETEVPNVIPAGRPKRGSFGEKGIGSLPMRRFGISRTYGAEDDRSVGKVSLARTPRVV